MFREHPVVQLMLARIKLFYREPEAIFWTYGFPLLMVIGLGVAFRSKPQEQVRFDIVDGPGAAAVAEALEGNDHFAVTIRPSEEAFDRLKKNKTPLLVEVDADGANIYHYDPTNPDSRAARAAVDDALQRAAGRQDVVPVHDNESTAPGARYIDFLVPGLIGMNLMGGGMWGIGFVLVDMRVRNLLKRLLATPMRRSHFLLSMVGGRAMFFIPEMMFLLLASRLLFDVPIQGHILVLVGVAFVGSMAFAGLGLLTACRAERLESVTGLMNLVMMPMWLMSGVFFSSERFPDFLQPFIRALPLTQLNDALRAIMLDGADLASQTVPLAILVGWCVVSFALALKWFRWR